ncbi:hypothetical protein PVK06_012210 [Gossypium arboreum]|uniref:RNase H type-1 domain-containing protein n=1 Tax=Gossypium arboreum TaxID=29729 RepID=A0ABR0QBU5_GOSAR|nr:hypothetical protein PVK06_012210 [Gossypium arboreum]
MYFLLPRSFCNEFEDIMAMFWWKKSTEKKGRARRILEKELRWKVGLGRKISIWDECWLLGPVPQRIQSTLLMKPCLLKVFLSTFPQDDCVVWGELAVLGTGALRSIPSTIVHWPLSSVNVAKVNVDDGFVLAQRKALFASETLAVVRGFRFAFDIGFLSVMLEGDSRSVIDKINDSPEDLSEISALIWEAKEVSKSFRDCRFSYSAQ